MSFYGEKYLTLCVVKKFLEYGHGRGEKIVKLSLLGRVHLEDIRFLNINLRIIYQSICVTLNRRS